MNVIAGLLVKPARVKVEGQVYCLHHTAVHDDSTLPYGLGDYCPKSMHRPVYAALRAGDPVEDG